MFTSNTPFYYSVRDENEEGYLIRRLMVGMGWAVHGLVFELWNDSRMGVMQANDTRSLNLLNEHSILSRSNGGWSDIYHRDYIIAISGHRLVDGIPTYLCHSVSLQWASGKTLSYVGRAEHWKGEPFHFDIMPHDLFTGITRLSETITGGVPEVRLTAIRTSIHLPVTEQNARYLPPAHKKYLHDLFQLADEIDERRNSRGESPLGQQAWWEIISNLRGWELIHRQP